MEDEARYIEALIELHRGLDRQGPGDAEYTDFILSQIPALPPAPRIADLGCGAGAGALILADKFRAKVKAVDLARDFLDQLSARAQALGLGEYIEVIEADIGKLDWPAGEIDLLWSEGAAYSITFDGALKAWRPLLREGGIAVISEMNYFASPPDDAVRQYAESVYPGIKTETENVALIEACGYASLGVQRLPAKAWWDNYYDPLREKINRLGEPDDEVLRRVIADTLDEMDYFARYQKDYGYSFYIMQAT